MLFSCIDVLVKLHYYSVVVVVVRGIVRIIQKDDPGLIFVPSLCFHYYTLLGRIQFNIHTWFVCLLLFIQKDVLDMTWFDLVCFFLQMHRRYEDGDSLVHGFCVCELSLE